MASDCRDIEPHLASLLLYGSFETRRSLSQAIADEVDPTLRQLLMATTRSNEPWLLRARCLEVLGSAAGRGPRHVAEQMLAELLTANTD